MNNIENIISTIIGNDIEIPDKIQNRVNETLKNKKKKKSIWNIIKKIVIGIISTLVTLVGGVGVYAVAGGTIEGIPASDWLGLKFSSKYVDYKTKVENQVAKFDDTTVELSSTLCNEGITILEFNLKLSEEDYKKLKIGESVITDEYIQIQENVKSNLRDNIIRELQEIKYNEEIQKGNYEIDLEKIKISEEAITEEYDKRMADIEKQIEERKNTSFVPALSLNNDQKGGTYNYDKFNPNIDWYASIYIDDTPYYVRNFENIEKISDYEYKIYVMYMLTDEETGAKNDFKITLKNNKLTSLVNWNSLLGWRNDCQWFARDMDSEFMKTPKITPIDLPLEFEVTVSKDAVLEDSKVIDNPEIESKFRNITQKVEKVVDSPIQTIVRIKHSSTKQSSNAYANRYDDPNIEHLPLTREYKVYDANGKTLSCFSTSNKNTLIYSDGTREDYDPHDIPNKKYSNATWENIEYLLIEKTDTDFIKIVPVETVRNPVEGAESKGGEFYYEMDPLIIKLKD